MKILIVEDEAAAVRRLSKMLEEIDPAIEIVKDLDSVESAINWLNDNPIPDLLFFDIHLADGSSFDIFQQVNITQPIIFITAYDEYALEAFRVNAIDYLLKPIKKTELENAINKYRQWQQPAAFDYSKLTETMGSHAKSKRFLIRFGQTIRVVDLYDVAYFYTSDKITFLVNKNGKRYPIDYSLEQLETTIDTSKFFRINRQFIVNIDAIDEMYAYSKSRVKLSLNPPCDMDTVVSTDRSPVFKKWLVGEMV
ncbi:MAG: LytTR family DNA-binding domain-containing protein [Saprospiraceae bacterium]